MIRSVYLWGILVTLECPPSFLCQWSLQVLTGTRWSLMTNVRQVYGGKDMVEHRTTDHILN